MGDDAAKVIEEGETKEGSVTEAFLEMTDEENKMPVDFYYDYEEHVSKAKTAEDSDLPADMLTL